jgi:hypothetical protein
MNQAEFERHVGAENICPSIKDALDRAAEMHQRSAARESAELVSSKH